MLKLILLCFLFLLSLLVVFRAPANLLWYVAILVTEFSWLFIALVIVLLSWKGGQERFELINTLLGFSAILLLLLPYWQAWQLAQRLGNAFHAVFPAGKTQPKSAPFNPLQIITGINARKVPYRTFTYDNSRNLTLHFYPAEKVGLRPCIIVIHGGSWAAGNNLQLPELNSELAKAGYHVASINYRLAPAYQFPAPVEDVQNALNFLRSQSANLQIDGNCFVLLGRSAGGQVALSAGFTLHEPSIKGVIDFYGPTDMIWGYENPTHPLVLDSRKIMEDYLGGTLAEKPGQYRQSSATETLTSKTPPVLMIYAENDPLVSPRHGNRLSVKLAAAGIPHFGLYLPWATHAFDYTLNGPGGQLSTWTVKRFLEVILEEEGY